MLSICLSDHTKRFTLFLVSFPFPSSPQESALLSQTYTDLHRSFSSVIYTNLNGQLLSENMHSRSVIIDGQWDFGQMFSMNFYIVF